MICVTHQDRFYDCWEMLYVDADLREADGNGSMQVFTLFVPEEQFLQIDTLPIECRAMRHLQKKSLHVPINIRGCWLMALVDTRATSCFI